MAKINNVQMSIQKQIVDQLFSQYEQLHTQLVVAIEDLIKSTGQESIQFGNLQIILKNNVTVYEMEQDEDARIDLVNAKLISPSMTSNRYYFSTLYVNQEIGTRNDFSLVTLIDSNSKIYNTELSKLPVQELYHLFNFLANHSNTIQVPF